jgi:hypothetical protein
MPSFPTPACPSVQPVSRLDCLSWDCPKIAPPPSCRNRSPLPALPCGFAFETGMPTPACVPPSWFRTTSTVSSSDPVRVCCNALPAMGFISFPVRRRESPRVAVPFPRCLPCPSKPSLRPKLRPNLPHVHANVAASSVETAEPRHRRVATPFTAVLASSSFPNLPSTSSFRSPARASSRSGR